MYLYYHSRNSGQIPQRSQFFHITVHNNHYHSSAKNCVAFLESYKRVVLENGLVRNTDIVRNVEPIELKWKGVITQGVLITPNTSRRIDAVFIYKDNPSLTYAGTNYTLIDFSDYDIRIEGPGTFELTFVVYSDNFSVLRESFVLKLGTGLNHIQFYKK